MVSPAHLARRYLSRGIPMAKLNYLCSLEAMVLLVLSVLSGWLSVCNPAHAGVLDSAACIRTTTMTQYESQGIRFVVSENDCDTLGNSVYSTIYASDAQGHHRVALIKFGPDERSPPPDISIQDDKTIVIAIDSVVDLVQQKNTYGSYKVIYRIRQVVYPTPKKK
jgi:hypothetical protein